MKYRSRAPGQGACLKGMSRTITKQAFTLAAITDAEKTKLRCKKEQSQWTVKYRSRALGQGVCLKGMSRTIALQGFTLTAINDAKKTKLRRKRKQSQWTVNIGQGHRTGSRCVLKVYVKDNYYARFHIPSSH